MVGSVGSALVQFWFCHRITGGSGTGVSSSCRRITGGSGTSSSGAGVSGRRGVDSRTGVHGRWAVEVSIHYVKEPDVISTG